MRLSKKWKFLQKLTPVALNEERRNEKEIFLSYNAFCLIMSIILSIKIAKWLISGELTRKTLENASPNISTRALICPTQDST